eukprot:CAMPEP_0118648548 /NCGR_PEP_ID=MMETSP0785-20121206/9214_1 /TAXON_ID=91992 /ORGANISM="Bolidomonas pacifica, Strain CCMP 1866" /LENGTH=858 /DNA_ID=CAMNT_0006540747 /DNA_START=208 /DNA_END=2782 /DNA_ORIENTATION=-
MATIHDDPTLDPNRISRTHAAPSEIPSRTEYKESLPIPEAVDGPNEVKHTIEKNFMRFRKGGSNSAKKIQILHLDELSENGGGMNDKKDKTNYESFSEFVIHPNDPFRRAFDLLTVFLVLYLIFKIPFDVGFDWYENSDSEEAWLIILDVWFFLDICLNFKTGYISNGTAVMHPKKVRYHYLAGWFFIDLVGTIPFKYFVQDGEKGKSIKLSKFFKIPKLLRISRVLKYMKNNKQVYDIFKVFVFILISIHLGSCLWMIAIDPCEDGYNIDDSPWCDQVKVWDMYSEALHVSTVMMLGVSNSHIMAPSRRNETATETNIPQTLNNAQLHIISIVFMVYGLFLAAFMISEMTVYVMGKTQGSSAFQRKIDRVNHEMEYYAVPFELREKVKAYYDYIWVNQKQYDEQIGLLSDKSMSTDLQRQLALHLFKDVVSHISFFADVDDIVLGQICLSLNTLVFLPLDMILFKGDVGKELFIIAKGVVEVMRDDLPKDKRKMANQILLRSGSFFGEIALVMEVRRTCSVQAKTVCEINILLQSTFDDILREHPDFAKRMNELVVARQMETSLARLGVDPNNTKFRQADLDFANEAVNAQMQAGLFRRENSGATGSKIPPKNDADHIVPLSAATAGLSVSSASLLNKKIFPAAAEREESRDEDDDSPSATPTRSRQASQRKREKSGVLTLKDGTTPNLFDELERRKSVGEIHETEEGKLKFADGELHYEDEQEDVVVEDPRRLTQNTIQGSFNPQNTYDIDKIHSSILAPGTPSASNNRVSKVLHMQSQGSAIEGEELREINSRISRTEKMMEKILAKIDPMALKGEIDANEGNHVTFGDAAKSSKSPKNSSLPPIGGVPKKKKER